MGTISKAEIIEELEGFMRGCVARAEKLDRLSKAHDKLIDTIDTLLEHTRQDAIRAKEIIARIPSEFVNDEILDFITHLNNFIKAQGSLEKEKGD